MTSPVEALVQQLNGDDDASYAAGEWAAMALQQ